VDHGGKRGDSPLLIFGRHVRRPRFSHYLYAIDGTVEVVSEGHWKLFSSAWPRLVCWLSTGPD